MQDVLSSDETSNIKLAIDSVAANLDHLLKPSFLSLAVKALEKEHDWIEAANFGSCHLEALSLLKPITAFELRIASHVPNFLRLLTVRVIDPEQRSQQ